MLVLLALSMQGAFGFDSDVITAGAHNSKVRLVGKINTGNLESAVSGNCGTTIPGDIHADVKDDGGHSLINALEASKQELDEGGWTKPPPSLWYASVMEDGERYTHFITNAALTGLLEGSTRFAETESAGSEPAMTSESIVSPAVMAAYGESALHVVTRAAVTGKTIQTKRDTKTTQKARFDQRSLTGTTYKGKTTTLCSLPLDAKCDDLMIDESDSCADASKRACPAALVKFPTLCDMTLGAVKQMNNKGAAATWQDECTDGAQFKCHDFAAALKEDDEYLGKYSLQCTADICEADPTKMGWKGLKIWWTVCENEIATCNKDVGKWANNVQFAALFYARCTCTNPPSATKGDAALRAYAKECPCQFCTDNKIANATGTKKDAVNSLCNAAGACKQNRARREIPPPEALTELMNRLYFETSVMLLRTPTYVYVFALESDAWAERAIEVSTIERAMPIALLAAANAIANVGPMIDTCLTNTLLSVAFGGLEGLVDMLDNAVGDMSFNGPARKRTRRSFDGDCGCPSDLSLSGVSNFYNNSACKFGPGPSNCLTQATCNSLNTGYQQSLTATPENKNSQDEMDGVTASLVGQWLSARIIGAPMWLNVGDSDSFGIPVLHAGCYAEDESTCGFRDKSECAVDGNLYGNPFQESHAYNRCVVIKNVECALDNAYLNTLERALAIGTAGECWGQTYEDACDDAGGILTLNDCPTEPGTCATRYRSGSICGLGESAGYFIGQYIGLGFEIDIDDIMMSSGNVMLRSGGLVRMTYDHCEDKGGDDDLTIPLVIVSTLLGVTLLALLAYQLPWKRIYKAVPAESFF